MACAPHERAATRGIRLLAAIALVVGCGVAREGNTRESPTQEAQRAMTTGPEAVVRLYSRLDTAGVFTCYGCDPAMDSVRDMLVCWSPSEHCATDSPAWDVALVASTYSVDVDSLAPGHAAAWVRYRLAGRVTGGEVELRVDSLDWKPQLEASSAGWRITGVESQRPPVLSRASAMRLARTSADSALLNTIMP